MRRKLRLLATLLRRRGPSSQLQAAARRHARSPRRDADACAALAADISGVPRDTLADEIAGWFPRQDYVNDRAFRLLVGVRDGGDVPPIDAPAQEKFAREEQLGRLPLPEAFEHLAASHPGLRDLEARARAGAKPPLRELRPVLLSVRDEHGQAAIGIVVRYLNDCRRGRDDPTPLFDRPSHYDAHLTIRATPGL